MTAAQANTRLATLGATPAEASLLSEILLMNGWHDIPAYKMSEQVRADMETWLADFRSERREQDQINERIRQAHIAAGYRVAS